MSSRALKLLEEVYRLSASDRAMLASELSQSVDEDPEHVSSAWAAEAVRRLEELDRGEVELVSAEDVDAYIEKLLAAG